MHLEAAHAVAALALALADARDHAGPGRRPRRCDSRPMPARSGASVFSRPRTVSVSRRGFARAPGGGVQRLGQDGVAAQLGGVVDPVVGVGLQHLLGRVLRAIQALALQLDDAPVGRARGDEGRGGGHAGQQAHQHEPDLRQEHRYSAPPRPRAARPVAAGDLDAQVVRLGADVDLLLVHPAAVAPDLQGGLAVGGVGQLEAALVVDRGEERRAHHEHRDRPGAGYSASRMA